MDAIELALRKCLHTLASSSTITERKRNVETFVELLKDNRIHTLLDSQDVDENTSNNTLTWNEMFNIIREYTVNEIASIRTKSAKTLCPDIKYQEALKLFKSLIENSNIHGPQLDGRSLLESIISILTSDVWSSCTIIIKELSHLLINHVLCFHKYLNEVREQEWNDLCRLYMSLSKYSTKVSSESEQALYSSYLKFLIEKVIIYNDFDSNKLNIRREILDFIQFEIEQMKNSNHFLVIENFLCSLNNWSFKYLFDMSNEIFRLGNELLASLIEIWRRKCSEKPKTEIIKFSRLQMSLHHPNQRKDIFENYDDLWMKNLRDINDLLLREIDELCHKQRSINRQNQNEFLVRFDLLHLASSVFYQLSRNEISIKNEIEEDFIEPSAKRTRYEHSMAISTNTEAQMKTFQNLFQSIDPFHQAVGFQIVSLQIQRKMILSSNDCEFYTNVLKRYLTDERRPSLLQNALQCLHLLLTSTTHCQFSTDFIALLQPLIHISICESFVIEILSLKHLSLSNLLSCSSLTAYEYLFNGLHSCSIEDENRFIEKFLPDLNNSYRNNEHDLATFFNSYSMEYTFLSAEILMKLSSFDKFPSERIQKSNEPNQFDQIENQWSQFKLLIPIDDKLEDKRITQINTFKCEFNVKIFQRIIDIYEKTTRFIQQLKDKHLGERSKLILHYTFLGIYILEIIEKYFSFSLDNNSQLRNFIENLQSIFSEFIDETHYFFEIKKQSMPFINDLFKYIQQSVSHKSHDQASILYAFFDAKFLSYLYNYSIDESSSSNDKYQSFEILLYLCYQALIDEETASKSFLVNYSSTYETNRNLLIRILDQKLSIYLEELSLPSSVSYRYLQIYLSHCSRTSFSLRLNDFECLLNLYSQLFRVYRRDIVICEEILINLKNFLTNFFVQIQEKFSSNDDWQHFRKLIDAFWQMTLNKNSSLNSSIRLQIIQIKQILFQDDEIRLNDIDKLANDPSYFVRIQTYRLAKNFFYENQSQLLKPTNKQKEIFGYFKEKHLLTDQFRYYLSDLSEYLSGQITYDFVKMFFNKQISKNLLRHILNSNSIESVLQHYQKDSKYSIKDFPWDIFEKIIPEKFYCRIFSNYFFADRSQLNSMFPDMKSAILKYFPQIQANLFVCSLKNNENQQKINECRQFIEQLMTKTEYNRLIKQNLTKIIYFLLTSFVNDQQNEFSDSWAPESIQPANTWTQIRHTFEYIKQILHAKTFIDILLKLTDIGDILLSLSSQIFSSISLHEQLRLFHVFSLFLNEILLNSMDNDYLHSVLRDSTYMILRFIETSSTKQYNELYEENLNEKIRNLICQLLDQLCLKGLDFDSRIYLEHIPDIISILINYESVLKRERIQPIFNHIYQVIKFNNESIHMFLTYTIQKLGYVSIENHRLSQSISTRDYFLYLSSIRSSIYSKWQLEMFNEHLDSQRDKTCRNSIEIDSSLINLVKARLLDCLKSKTNEILAGQCLAKCWLILNNFHEKIHLEDKEFQADPSWIFDDLLMFYLIDKQQSIVECTRLTLTNIFHHSLGQNLYEKHSKNNLLQIYAKPFLSPLNFSTKIQSNFPSASNPWFINPKISFDSWLISLVNCLLKQIDFYYNEKNETGSPYALIFLELSPLIQLKIDLAKNVFPYLIYSLLLLPMNFNFRQSLTKHFRYLIDQLNENKDESNHLFNQISRLVFETINSLKQCSIDCINKRVNSTKNLKDSFQNHFWLDLDYFQLAKCASKYHFYQSASLYIDIWTSKQRSILTNNDYSTHLYRSDIDLFSNSSNLVDLYVRIHSNCNQSDEFYGLEKYFQTHPNLSGEYQQLNRNYYESLFYFDQSYSIVDSTKLIQSLRFCGLNHILEQYLHQISSLSNEIFYRIELTSILTEINPLTQWTNLQNENQSVRENLLTIIQKQKSISKAILPQLNLDDLWSNANDLRECSLINIIDDLKMIYENENILSNIWNNPITDDRFDENDELLLTRLTLTQKLLVHHNDEVKQPLCANILAQLCENACQSNKFQLCERYLNDFSSLISPNYSHELTFLRAKILVLRQQDTAGEYLRQILQTTLPDTIQIRCRLLLCDWLNKTRSETSLTIKQQLDLISNSLQTLDKSQISLIFESYLALAYFSDNEYQRLNQLFHSPIFENKRLLIERNQIEFAKQEKLDPLGRYTKVLKRSLDMDKKEIDEQKKLQYNYLISTLNNYLISLKLFSHLNKKPVKLNEQILSKTNSVPDIMITSKCLSYWLTNSNNADVNKSLKKNLLQIPTHFFLPFVYQMAARMALTNEQISVFHSILLEYLSQCILDHPHHVLPIIFALANAHKDAHINQQVTKKTTSNSSQDLIELNNEIHNDPRSRAAKYLLDKCAKDKPQLVEQMRKLNDAYIEAAYWENSAAKTDSQGKNPTFPRQLRLTHIKDFHEVAVPTITIPVSTDGNYKNIETIKSFNNEYAMVGGVNAPKKLICHSSTGRQLPQLLKGKDDLRQDAVMQQLFNVVNRLLEKDDLTSHRDMRIRTYKVVPLTQKSGVLEWCEGTITFGDYLTKEKEGAHPRYYPEDWTAMDCRRHVHKATNLSKDERKRAFIQACSKLKPVFRYFFYENYNQPNLWQKKKQNYAKSVATSSIVGYIVGLGDRHVQNILIDTQTAEVIHIDLGVAFDQGKMLPIPETIPFRLTRDVIDGLGICGTEGLFKKTCEITLELMRQYADTLITIIEVFLYDPLYQWQISPQKALQLQQQFDKTNHDSATPASFRSSGRVISTLPPSASTAVTIIEPFSTDTNKMAERLLLGLRQKLQGVERLNQMTIKAHVNMLIQEATSIENLSQLFAGWQPYL